MEEIKIKDKTLEKGMRLTDGQKKAVDQFVNGTFMVFGMAIILGAINGTDIRIVMGLLSFYIGVRFFPR